MDYSGKIIMTKRKNMAGSSSCGTKISKAADSLSSLPDNVLTVIFSFLTTKEAFSTCISCKKLKHLMTVIPNVECKETGSDCLTQKREFMESVSRFLENHDSLIKKFHLSFNPLGYRYRSDVCYWLSFVLKNGLEELDLVFNGSNNLMFLPSLLTAPNLKVLKLSHCVVNLRSIISFKSLKSLLLGSMNISGSVIGLICCHCESLQHFTLEYCSGFTKIEILDPKSKLETLILNDCQTFILDNLFAPFALKISSLKTLSIRQKIINFFFVGSPHINNLILCRQAEVPVTLQESRNMKDRIIGSLGNVRTLQLAGWAFECFTAYRLNHQLSKLEKILLLDFNVCLKNMEGLTNLIGHTDGVKKLHISINENNAGNIDSDFERVLEHFSDDDYRLPSTVAFRNSAVHIINIQGFTGTLYEMSHIKFMLAHFPRLRHLEVTPIKEMDEDQGRAYADLISDFPMLSASVEIVMGSAEHFICKNIEA